MKVEYLKKIVVAIIVCIVFVISMLATMPTLASSEHYIILTFDDGRVGWQGNQALQIMSKFGYRGVAFLVVDRIINPSYVGYPNYTLLTNLVPMGWEIGCHSWTHNDSDHYFLNHLSLTDLLHEINDSKIWLQSNFTTNVTSFAYPWSNGYDNNTVLKALNDSGYLYARQFRVSGNMSWNGSRSFTIPSYSLNHNNYLTEINNAVSDSLANGTAVLTVHSVTVNANSTADQSTLNLLPSDFQYCLNAIKSAGLNVVTFSDLRTQLPLKLKLSGEFDYTSVENIKIKIAALVTYANASDPVPGARITIRIYDLKNTLWVSDSMTEIDKGIHTWESNDTVPQVFASSGKGVFVVYAQASKEGCLNASDVIEFHIDPPPESTNNNDPLLITVGAALALTATIALTFAYVEKKKKPREESGIQKCALIF